jgi:hypothetical protein
MIYAHFTRLPIAALLCFLNAAFAFETPAPAATRAALPGANSEGATGVLRMHEGTGVLSLELEGGRVTFANGGFAGPFKYHPDGAYRWLPIAIPDSKTQAACVSFGLDSGRGEARFIGALLVKPAGGAWGVAREWLAECGPIDEISFKREKQSFSSPADGVLLRKAKKYKSEGHTFKLDCGCQVCQSATFEYTETETWQWSTEASAFKRASFVRAYIVQYGEGLMGVARKALGDARLMSKLYRLNSDIKPGGMLREGQEVVFERIDGSAPAPADDTSATK